MTYVVTTRSRAGRRIHLFGNTTKLTTAELLIPHHQPSLGLHTHSCAHSLLLLLPLLLLSSIFDPKAATAAHFVQNDGLVVLVRQHGTGRAG
jgi:hypothetical protein